MVVIVYIDVYVKMEENVILVMDIVFVYLDLQVIDVNHCVHKVHLDICVYKNVNVEMIMFVIHEQVKMRNNFLKNKSLFLIEGECNSLSCNGDSKCLLEQQRKKLLISPCPEGNSKTA
jgi:hypothetical protein